MINTETANILTCYKSWADRLTFEAVMALPDGEPALERPSLFKSIIGTLNHSYLVDLIWKANLEGRSHGFATRNIILHADLPNLWTAQRAYNEWFINWSDAQTDQSLRELVSFHFMSGELASATRGEVIMHIVNHATYHRGWVSDLFFQIPAKPPTTDLSVFMTQERATYSGGALYPEASANGIASKDAGS